MKNSRKKRRDAVRHSKIRWEDVYELPLHLDKYGCYAFSKNDTMALSFEYGESEEEYINAVKRWKDWVACINGEKESETKGRWTHDVCDFYLDGKEVFSVRGWGHLTGCGAMCLPPKEASRIQDGFIQHIFEQLNGKQEQP